MADPVQASIVEHFQTGEEPRIERTKQHLLLDIFVTALCTLLTGGEGCQDMALWGKSKRAGLQTFLALPHGLPSHDTLGRVFARLNPQRFQACFLSWPQAVAQLMQGALVSLDGKTVQASCDRATASSPGQMLSAWCSEHGGLGVGQVKTASKSNAIMAMPDLLPLLAIKGCIVTIDAMGCQTAVAAQIQDQGGDDLLALQGNHTKAYTAIKAHFHQEIEHHLAWRNDHNFFAAFDDPHGRTVRRRVWTMTDLAALEERAKWPGLQAVSVVETIRMAHQHAPVTSDYRFSRSSLVRSATAFSTMIRQHWDIETKLHWSLDVTGNEERCRIRKAHAAANMVAVRHMALNLLRQEHSRRRRLRQKRLLCRCPFHTCAAS